MRLLHCCMIGLARGAPALAQKPQPRSEGGTAPLLHIREPLLDQLHRQVDESLCVAAGSGIRVAGRFRHIPRGVQYRLRREGRKPPIAPSIHAVSRCTAGEEAVR